MRKLLDSSNGLRPEEAQPTIPIQGRLGRYEVIRPIAATQSVRYHLCRNQNGEWRILSIAVTVADNPTVSWIAETLSDLGNKSALLEQEYHKSNLNRVSYFGFVDDLLYAMRRDAVAQGRLAVDRDQPATAEELEAIDRQREEILNCRLHYDWLMPVLIESFVCESQGRRQVNILSFAGIDAGEFMPLSQIPEKGQRVDLKTSAWIIGRMLKLLGFVIQAQISVSFKTEKFLIGPKEHHLVLLDWTNAREVFGDNREGVNLNILRIGECGLNLIGANFDKTGWQYNYPIEENEREYIAFLHRMATLSQNFYRSRRDALDVHRMFYNVVEQVWGKAYHPFTTFPR